MLTRAVLIAGLILMASVESGFADEPGVADEPRTVVKNTTFPSAGSGLLGLGSMAEAAADLRKAGEAFERFATTFERLGATVAESLAAMSSEFDPFGYKTAFRTLSQQAEMLEQQRELIGQLREREIERLRRENRQLTKQLNKLRKRKSMNP